MIEKCTPDQDGGVVGPDGCYLCSGALLVAVDYLFGSRRAV